MTFTVFVFLIFPLVNYVEGPVGMVQAALLWGAVIYVLESTSVRPVSRYEEQEFSLFKGKTRF